MVNWQIGNAVQYRCVTGAGDRSYQVDDRRAAASLAAQMLHNTRPTYRVTHPIDYFIATSPATDARRANLCCAGMHYNYRVFQKNRTTFCT